MKVPYKDLCRALGVKESIDKEDARQIAETLDSPLSEIENTVTRMFFDMFPKATSMAVTATLLEDIVRCHLLLNHSAIISNVEEIFRKEIKSINMPRPDIGRYKDTYLDIVFTGEEYLLEDFLDILSENKWVSKYDYNYSLPKGVKSPFADQILKEISNISYENVLVEAVDFVNRSKDKERALENIVYIVETATEFDIVEFRSDLREKTSESK